VCAVRTRGSGLVILGFCLYVPESKEGHMHLSTLSDSLLLYSVVRTLTSFAGERF